MLSAGVRNLADARVTRIGLETRFDAAYEALMESALAALWRMATGRTRIVRGIGII